ncbi:hypothetical protein AVEN_165028-1 [Araneus ventricosus]|uniref:Uncharacterized protein n=1 Tax=Araneus ventricosus TaxID=182803 RepID=A0A4Y2GIA5_ARAVE|nr:hypothetical protein AVEN_165028-1 [Araneus ventricosus]
MLTSSFAELDYSIAALRASICAWNTELAGLSMAFQVLVTASFAVAQKALPVSSSIFELSVCTSIGVLLEGTPCPPCEILSSGLKSSGFVIDGGDG